MQLLNRREILFLVISAYGCAPHRIAAYVMAPALASAHPPKSLLMCRATGELDLDIVERIRRREARSGISR